jgi:hypothetical protein
LGGCVSSCADAANDSDKKMISKYFILYKF